MSMLSREKIWSTRAMWQGAAPLAIQLAHAGGIAHNAALADAAEADNGAHCAPVPRDLCIRRHAGTITQNHCSREKKKGKRYLQCTMSDHMYKQFRVK